ncbi:hypothetical protein HDU76_000684, partial [Blyttiomyces sp. JEL0837]
MNRIIKRDSRDFYSTIVLQSASNFVIDFPTPNGVPAPAYTQLQIFNFNNGDNQFFKFVPINQYRADNLFTIVHLGTGGCVDALSFGTTNGSPVGLYACNGKENQIWSLKPYNGGYFIVSFLSNRCLNNAGGAHTNENKIILYDCDFGSFNIANNVWYGENIRNDAAIGNFFTQIMSQQNLVLDFPTVNNIPSPQGTQLQLWENNGGPAQQFRFVHEVNDPDYYYIVNQFTGMCVEVLNNAVTDGSPVALVNCNFQDRQRWKIIPRGVGDQTFRVWITAKQSGKCLNEYGAQFRQRDKIVIWGCGTDNWSGDWDLGFNGFNNKELINQFNAPILPNVQVIVLYWGNVNYASYYPAFYQTLLSSRVLEALGQYGIGRGSYQGSMQLPPPGAPPLPTGNPPDFSGYLHRLTQLGYLKPNANTYYALHFAPNT